MKKSLIIAAATFVLSACGGNSDLMMVVGTYTDTESEGLYPYVFDEEAGEARLLDSCRVENPSYLTLSDDGRRIYAVSEMHDNEAAVVALTLDPTDGSFGIINSQKTCGADPCYVSTNGKVVVTANYGGSMSVFPTKADGGVGEMTGFYKGGLGGPDSIRQCEPHIHCTEFAPDGKSLYVTDFSADRLLVFAVTDTCVGQLKMCVDMPADNGPRHIISDRSGKHAYVIGELSGMITVFDVDGMDMSIRQIVDADPGDSRSSADIHLSPDGHYLYASVRQPTDCIAIYSVDATTGELTEVGIQKTGLHPRNFNITPNGKYLLCACRDSNRIDVYRIDAETGLLTDTGRPIKLPHPVCVKWVQ